MKFYDQSVPDVERCLDTNIHTGLDTTQVKQRQEKYGPNKLKEAKQKSNFARFVDQFKDPMIIILLIAAAFRLESPFLKRIPKDFSNPF